MVYRESGRFPLEIIAKLRMSKFWLKLIQNESKWSSILCRLMLSLHSTNSIEFQCITYATKILSDIGLSYI